MKFLPETLNINMLLATHPPANIKFFKREHLIYILDLITSIPYNNKDILIINGYIPISSFLMQKKIRNYRQYITYLLRSQVILTDNQFIKGKKSIGYKFSSKYNDTVVVLVEEEAISSKAARPRKGVPLKIRRKYDHLTKWYNANLKIQYSLAMDYIKEEFRLRLKAMPIRSNNLRIEKDPIIQYNSAIIGIEKFAAFQFQLSIDSNIYRLHSSLSRLKSELRNFLTYDDMTLVSIDIKNSQPFLSTLLLEAGFWDGSNANIGKLTIGDISSLDVSDIFTSISYSSFIMLCKSAGSADGSDVHKYIELVKNGQIYEYLAAQLSKRTTHEFTSRKEIKALFFQIMFTDNRFLGQTEAMPKRIFKELFPSVYELFSLIKKRDKTYLPRLLQTIESHILLLLITKRISTERKDLPIFTIHDSIITTVGNEDYIMSTIEEEMERLVSFTPKFGVEQWLPENLRHYTSDGSQLAA